jgi:ribosomal protein L23
MFIKYKEFKNAVIKANLLKEEDFYDTNTIFTKYYCFNVAYNKIIPEKLVKKYRYLTYCETILFKCCLFGKLDILKFLIENEQTKIYKKCNYKKIAFKLSCFKGCTSIAKYLYDIFDIKNEKINIIKIFNKTCENNKLSTAKWLFNIFDIKNKKINTIEIFNKACENNKLLLAKWLYKTFNINVANCYDLFYNICKKSNILLNLRIAKWLYEIGKFDLVKNDDIYKFFMEKKNCSNRCCYFMLKWLISLNDCYMINEEKDNFIWYHTSYLVIRCSKIDYYMKTNKLLYVIKLLRIKII